jgi:hypothetical protein
MGSVHLIIDHDPPHVFDGNNRLIAMGTIDGMENMFIKCYLGEYIS